jgi:hypothetical protein
MPKQLHKKAIAPKAKKTRLNLQLREILGDAYSFVLGEKLTKSVSSIPLESLMRMHIEQIEGVDGMTSIRLNKKDEVTKIMNSITGAVDAVKALPPSAFSLSSEDSAGGNTNTSIDGDEEIPL